MWTSGKAVSQSAVLSAFSASDERGQVGMVPDIAAYRLTFSSPDASVSALTGKDFDTVSMGVDGLQLNGAWEVLDAALTRSGRKAVAVTLVLDGSALGQAWIISPYPEDSTFIAYTRRDAAQVYDRLVFRK